MGNCYKSSPPIVLSLTRTHTSHVQRIPLGHHCNVASWYESVMAADNVSLHQCAGSKSTKERCRAWSKSRRWSTKEDASSTSIKEKRWAARTSFVLQVARSSWCHPETHCCVLLIWLRFSLTRAAQTMIYVPTHCIILSRTILTSNLAYSHLDIHHVRTERNIIIDRVD